MRAGLKPAPTVMVCPSTGSGRTGFQQTCGRQDAAPTTPLLALRATLSRKRARGIKNEGASCSVLYGNTDPLGFAALTANLRKKGTARRAPTVMRMRRFCPSTGSGRTGF